MPIWCGVCNKNVILHSNVTFEQEPQLLSSGEKLKCNVWEELSPSFKELVSCLEDENEILHIGYVKSWLDYQIVLSKDRQFKNTPNHDKKKYL